MLDCDDSEFNAFVPSLEFSLKENKKNNVNEILTNVLNILIILIIFDLKFLNFISKIPVGIAPVQVSVNTFLPLLLSVEGKEICFVPSRQIYRITLYILCFSDNTLLFNFLFTIFVWFCYNSNQTPTSILPATRELQYYQSLMNNRILIQE